jgi:hypothetical protein
VSASVPQQPVRTVAPRAADIRRWRRYLADEQLEAAVYRDLAQRRTGEEREILLALAEAELRHEEHWRALLGERAGATMRGALRTRVLGFLARRFGSVFVLALAQRAEGRSPYDTDSDATAAMAADERIHEEVVRGLATRGRMRLSGTFRAAVFGANDGLVSNLALVIGISASGVPTHVVLLTGIAGLLAGALSMGAGEYVSVRSQRELLESSTPDPEARTAVADLDVDANELALVYRARGMSESEAEEHAREVLRTHDLALTADPALHAESDEHEAVGTGLSALSVRPVRFCCAGDRRRARGSGAARHGCRGRHSLRCVSTEARAASARHRLRSCGRHVRARAAFRHNRSLSRR